LTNVLETGFSFNSQSPCTGSAAADGDIALLKTGGELLVMNAGGYKFSDFVKVGTPLTILMWATLSVILSVAYGL
jgi:di/tricarboxylate transporter